jgi:large subunit ribosomal protein L4
MAIINKSHEVGAAPTVNIRKIDGSTAGTVTLDAQVFARTPNIPLMHQVVNAQLAARRAGTQSTKTRAEVAGGGAKPRRQKGTGSSRQGSTNAPHWSGGGVALGPKPRDYSQKTPKKMVRLALLSALSDRAASDRVIVTNDFAFEAPKTKSALAALKAWEVEGNALVVLGDDDENAYLSFRNIPKVHVVHEAELNTYDVLKADYVIFTEATLPTSASTSGEYAASTTEAAAPTEAGAK